MESSSLLPPPMSLWRAHHYHQPHDSHPSGPATIRAMERVELITGGRGWFEMEGELVEVTPGALLWHVEGDRSISRSDLEDPYRCLSVHFVVEPFAGMRRAPRLSWWKDLDEVRDFTAEVSRWMAEPDFDRQALLEYTYGRLIFQVRVWERGSLGHRQPPGLRRALDLIDAQFTRELRLSALAEAAGWSEAHLYEVFRAHLAQTPHQVILHRRLERARELLAATDLPVKWIAGECGFASSASFCQIFRKRVGMTPSDYRQQEEQIHLPVGG